MRHAIYALAVCQSYTWNRNLVSKGEKNCTPKNYSNFAKKICIFSPWNIFVSFLTVCLCSNSDFTNKLNVYHINFFFLMIAWGWSRYSLCRPFNPNYVNFRKREMCRNGVDGMVRLQYFLWKRETGASSSAEKSANSAGSVWCWPWGVKAVSRRMLRLGFREQG